MLPTYTRLGTSTSSNNQLSSKLLMGRRALRTREKFLILLLFATFTFVCFGGVFYLPDNFVATDKVREVYKKIQSAGPEIFIPAPPIARHHRHNVEPNGDANAESDDEHILGDRNRLNAKIQGDTGDNDHLEKPQAPVEAPVMNPPSPEIPNAQNPAEGVGVADAPDSQSRLPNGEDADPVARERRNKVREVKIALID